MAGVPVLLLDGADECGRLVLRVDRRGIAEKTGALDFVFPAALLTYGAVGLHDGPLLLTEIQKKRRYETYRLL